MLTTWEKEFMCGAIIIPLIHGDRSVEGVQTRRIGRSRAGSNSHPCNILSCVIRRHPFTFFRPAVALGHVAGAPSLSGSERRDVTEGADGESSLLIASVARDERRFRNDEHQISERLAWDQADE